MDDDFEHIHKLFVNLAETYQLSPKAAQELLKRILSILEQYQQENITEEPE